MTDLSQISDDELLFDRQESFNDITACLLAKVEGAVDLRDRPVQERMAGNINIIETIEAECKRRGFAAQIYRPKETKT